MTRRCTGDELAIYMGDPSSQVPSSSSCLPLRNDERGAHFPSALLLGIMEWNGKLAVRIFSDDRHDALICREWEGRSVYDSPCLLGRVCLKHSQRAVYKPVAT